MAVNIFIEFWQCLLSVFSARPTIKGENAAEEATRVCLYRHRIGIREYGNMLYVNIKIFPFRLRIPQVLQVIAHNLAISILLKIKSF